MLKRNTFSCDGNEVICLEKGTFEESKKLCYGECFLFHHALDALRFRLLIPSVYRPCLVASTNVQTKKHL